MTGKEEEQLNNLEDHYCIMYAILGRTLMEDFGVDGEAILRQGTRYYGQNRGRLHRQRHLDAGLKINMYQLFTSGGDLPGDTRTFREAQRISAEERVSHTLTCPMADIWNAYGCMDIGRIYCEEFHYACYNTYAYGYTKVNIAKTLTQEGDEYCSFNVVLRKADLPEELQKVCFEECDPDYVPPEEVNLPVPGAKEGYRSLYLRLYYFLLQVAVEMKGEAGRTSIGKGLNRLAQIVAKDFIKKTEGKVDQDFLEENYPLNMKTGKEAMWATYFENDARGLVERELIRPLLKSLGLEREDRT